MELREDLKAGDEITIQIAPFGEYPAESVGGVELVEVFDREGFEKIIENWKADGAKLIRCDFDHKSEMTDDTVASGWLKDLFIDDEKGLMGTLVVSESGANSLNGLDYRFGSPVFVLDDANKPTHLLSYAFTNRPRLKDMDAVYNSEKPVAEKVVNAETEDLTTQEKDKEIMDVKIIKEILGLPEEATEEDIRNTLAEIMEKFKKLAEEEARLEAERLQKEAEEKEAALVEEAEEIANECGVEDEEDKKEIVNSYKTNPELVKTVINALKKSTGKMVINSAEAVKPELTDFTKCREEFEKLPGGQARVDYILAHRDAFK